MAANSAAVVLTARMVTQRFIGVLLSTRGRSHAGRKARGIRVRRGSLAVLRPQPLPRLDLPHQLLIDMREDVLLKGILDLLKLSVAPLSSELREQRFLHQILERVLLAASQGTAIGDAQKGVEALPVRAVRIGEMLFLHG